MWALMACLAAAAGCAPVAAPPLYTAYDAGRPMSVEYGVVDDARPVRLQGQPTGGGAAVGATVGAIAGAAAGSNSYSGSWWGSLAGALIGGLAGNAIETDAATVNGVELRVTMEDGRRLAFVQGAEEIFQPGDQVEILTAPDGTARVQHPRR
jgi:outer membrane lipoprotein SlyB